MLTTKEAWLTIAGAFMQRAAGKTEFTLTNDIASLGLCNAIETLQGVAWITGYQASQMFAVIEDLSRDLDGVYTRWPARVHRNRMFRANLALLLHEEAI